PEVDDKIEFVLSEISVKCLEFLQTGITFTEIQQFAVKRILNVIDHRHHMNGNSTRRKKSGERRHRPFGTARCKTVANEADFRRVVLHGAGNIPTFGTNIGDSCGFYWWANTAGFTTPSRKVCSHWATK